MRAVSMLLTACVLSLAGCSSLVISSGQDLTELTTRVQVHEAFGLPVEAGRTGSQAFEDFITHRKIAEPWKGIYLAMGDASTLGLGEIIWFPHQLYIAGRRSIVGQQLRFTYDDADYVTGVCHDGEAVPWAVAPRN